MVMLAGISEEQKKKDFQMMLACSTHLGTKNLDYQMTRYVWKRKPDGIHIINLGRTYDKLQLAARIIVAIENPADVCVISARPYGQRSILKYCQYTGATPIAGRFTPGTFTNQITNKFMEPRLLLLLWRGRGRCSATPGRRPSAFAHAPHSCKTPPLSRRCRGRAARPPPPLPRIARLPGARGTRSYSGARRDSGIGLHR